VTEYFGDPDDEEDNDELAADQINPEAYSVAQ
jgi:hypothetical protein